LRGNNNNTGVYIVVACSPYRYRIDLDKRLTYTKRRPVRGVTTLNNKIFIIYYELPYIVVYMSHEPYTRLRNIYIKGLRHPRDIAAGSSCLYMSDTGIDAIWQVNAADSKVDIQVWLSGLKAMSVSVTSEEKLVLLVKIDMIEGSVEERSLNYHGEIHIYSAGAVKETVIKLSPDIVSPFCVAMTTGKTFIVSYGLELHEMNRVCEVDMNGLVLKAFGSAPGKDVGQLNTPLRVSLDGDDRIMVTDTYNQRVLLLNKELVLQRVLVTWHQRSHYVDAGYPFRLHYDSHSGKLLVGLGTGQLDIYQLHT